MAQPQPKNVPALNWELETIQGWMVIGVTSPLLVLPQTPLEVALPVCKACESQEVCPIWGRKAENSYILGPGVDDGCHDKQCCSGIRDGRCCQAARVHSDHQQFWSQQSRRISQLCVLSFLRQGKRLLRPQCQAGGPPTDDCKGPQLHKGQPACDVESGHGDTRICSGACSDAQSTAMCPWLASL